jgi:hypothetical protein
MAIDYSISAIPKGSPRIVDKVRKQKIDQQAERICRSVVRARDKGRCRIPNCNERDVEMHHIVPRSRSSKLKWHPGNNCLLCKGITTDCDTRGRFRSRAMPMGNSSSRGILIASSFVSEHPPLPVPRP